jgi:phosphoribosylaminoimidazole (AIR) synthetase
MPGMYHGADYDLAGFCVGIVEKDAIIDGSLTRAGDVVLGLPSSGPHSNGFSLIRKILQVSGADVNAPLGASALIEQLMAPTRIYVKPLLRLMREIAVHGVSHITVSSTTFRGYCPMGWKPCCNAVPGCGRRCSTGCRPKAGFPMRKCFASSTAASA